MDDAVNKLLELPSQERIDKYYSSIDWNSDCLGAVRVADAGVDASGQFCGKGLVANRSLDVDEVVLKEAPLVAAQHTANKQHAVVCSYCFRYLNSIEHQIGSRLLHLLEAKAKGAGPSTASADASENTGASSSAAAAAGQAGPSSSAAAAAEDAEPSSGLEQDDDLEEDVEDDEDESSRGPLPPEEYLRELQSSSTRLPYSEKFELPRKVACPGGCEEQAYCSQECAQAAWGAHHQLLCQGPPTPPAAVPQPVSEPINDSAEAAGGEDSSAPPERQPASESADADAGVSAAPAAAALPAARHVDLAGLRAFKAHADSTNDIFHVAAQVVASTIVRAEAALGAGREASEGERAEALLAAWEPFAMGWKRIWWECVSRPEDVPAEDEAVFRQQLRDLASESVEHLRAALPGYAAKYPALFALEVYGSIVGMFELNNLALVVASPVEDYFLHVDDLEEGPHKAQAQALTQPLLDALDKDYDIPCEGTAFYRIQSCANHSCAPNAHAMKRDEDVSGHCVLLAKIPIEADQAVTICYVNEEDGLRKRRTALQDYGFQCNCIRCTTEEARLKAKKKAKAKGKK